MILIILDCLPLFVPPTGWTLFICFMNFLSSPALLRIAKIPFCYLSFASSFPGFQGPVTIVQNLQENWSASSSGWDNIILTFLTTASSASIVQTVPWSLPNLTKNYSVIFCCFWIVSDSLALLVLVLVSIAWWLLLVGGWSCCCYVTNFRRRAIFVISVNSNVKFAILKWAFLICLILVLLLSTT